jgi:hypothetical protein
MWEIQEKYFGRGSAIVQKSKVFDNSKLERPSIILLNNQLCSYNLNIETDILMRDYGKSGVIFRYLNE